MVTDVYCTKNRAINGKVDNMIDVICEDRWMLMKVWCVACISLLVVQGPCVWLNGDVSLYMSSSLKVVTLRQSPKLKDNLSRKWRMSLHCHAFSSVSSSHRCCDFLLHFHLLWRERIVALSEQ